MQEGQLALPDTAPWEQTTITLPYTLPAGEAGAEYQLNVSFTLAQSTLWAERGFEMAFAQFALPVAAPALPRRAIAALPEAEPRHDAGFHPGEWRRLPP